MGVGFLFLPTYLPFVVFFSFVEVQVSICYHFLPCEELPLPLPIVQIYHDKFSTFLCMKKYFALKNIFAILRIPG